MGFFDGLVNNIRDLARPYNDDDDFERDFEPEDVVPPQPVTVQEPAKPKVRTFGRGQHSDAAQPAAAPEPAPAPKRAARSQPVISNTPARPDVKLMSPSAYNHNVVKEIAEYLRSGYVVILNLQECPTRDTCRMLDFLAGFTFALGGNIACAAKDTYTITPSDVGVSRDSNNELKSGSVTL